MLKLGWIPHSNAVWPSVSVELWTKKKWSWPLRKVRVMKEITELHTIGLSVLDDQNC